MWAYETDRVTQRPMTSAARSESACADLGPVRPRPVGPMNRPTPAATIDA